MGVTKSDDFQVTGVEVGQTHEGFEYQETAGLMKLLETGLLPIGLTEFSGKLSFR